MGVHELKRKAAAYLEQAKDTAFAQRMTKENQELRDRLAAQEIEIKRLSEMFDAMRAGTPQPKEQDGNSTRARATRSG
jgi:hypothetical protein